MNGITCTLIGGGAGYYLRATLICCGSCSSRWREGLSVLERSEISFILPPDTSASFPNPQSVQELDRSTIDLRKQHGGAKFSCAIDGGP